MPSIVCKWVQLWLKGQPSGSEKRLQRGRSGLGGLKRCWESVARRKPSTACHWRWAPPGERLYPDWSGPTGADMSHLEPEMTTLKWSVGANMGKYSSPKFQIYVNLCGHPNWVKYGIFTSLFQVPGNGLKQVTCLWILSRFCIQNVSHCNLVAALSKRVCQYNLCGNWQGLQCANVISGPPWNIKQWIKVDNLAQPLNPAESKCLY